MGQKMSIASRRELVRVTYERYQKAKTADKRLILDEFVAATGYHRKYAIEVLLHPPRLRPLKSKGKRRCQYGVMDRQSLVSLWKLANCICSKRLVALLPELLDALERHGEMRLEERPRQRLLAMSAATMDRLLQSERRSMKPHGKSTTKPGTLLRQQIPVRTFAQWDEKKPGFAEIDLVAHCNDDGGGEFLYSLMLTDVHTGWCEYAALLNKGQFATVQGIDKLRQMLPFCLLGVDSDNGSEFINSHLLRYCKEHKLTFTRCRPYRKNDQCHVEQKNWSIIRRTVGYDRYEGTAACRALAELYQVLRLYQNFFQPCMKLISKQRCSTARGERTVKHYDTPKTPYRRVLESGVLSKEAAETLKEQYEQLNPKGLLAEVRRLQRKLWEKSVTQTSDQAERRAG